MARTQRPVNIGGRPTDEQLKVIADKLEAIGNPAIIGYDVRRLAVMVRSNLWPNEVEAQSMYDSYSLDRSGPEPDELLRKTGESVRELLKIAKDIFDRSTMEFRSTDDKWDVIASQGGLDDPDDADTLEAAVLALAGLRPTQRQLVDHPELNMNDRIVRTVMLYRRQENERLDRESSSDPRLSLTASFLGRRTHTPIGTRHDDDELEPRGDTNALIIAVVEAFGIETSRPQLRNAVDLYRQDRRAEPYRPRAPIRTDVPPNVVLVSPDEFHAPSLPSDDGDASLDNPTLPNR
jgi:hypothetical protein